MDYERAQPRSMSFSLVSGFTQAGDPSLILKIRFNPFLHSMSSGKMPLFNCFIDFT